MYLNLDQQKFGRLLQDSGVMYYSKVMCPLKEGGYIVPDFYLPDYKGYLELVVTSLPSVKKLARIGREIEASGLKISFYNIDGTKHLFWDKTLDRAGINGNHRFFSVEELKKTVKSVWLSEEQRKSVYKLYHIANIRQEVIANFYGVSQALVSKIVNVKR